MLGGTGDTRHNIAYPVWMTTVKIAISDDIYHAAKAAGYLEPERFAEMLRKELIRLEAQVTLAQESPSTLIP